MKETKLELSPTCHLVHTDYSADGNGVYGVTLEYTERTPDAWYGDTETCIDLDEGKAKEIVDFLTNAFNL